MNRLTLTVVLGILLTGFGGLRPASAQVRTVPEELKQKLKLSPFYEKFNDALGVPVLASRKTSDVALEETRFLTEQMLNHRPEIAKAIADAGVRIAIMARDEFTTDVPEHSDLTPAAYWNQRARGLGATKERPAVSCGEENLLCLEGDPYSTENIFIHEFGHVIHEIGMAGVDRSFDDRLRAAYDAAIAEGLWKGKYASTNRSEYWAEGVQSWFDTNRENDHDHNHVNTRAELREYDPHLAALCEEVFGDEDWRYTRPDDRSPPSPHFAGFDRATAGSFQWPQELAVYREKFRNGEVGLEPDTAVRLAPRAADDADVKRSPSSRRRSNLWLRNRSGAEVTVDWIDFDGKPRGYGSVRDGDHHEQQTFVGHVFRVTLSSGKAVYLVADGDDCSAVIEAESADSAKP